MEEWSSSDVTVQEGDSVWLHCNVTGVPPPTVTWHRRTTSGRDVHDCRQRTVDAGKTLLIRQKGKGKRQSRQRLVGSLTAHNGLPYSKPTVGGYRHLANENKAKRFNYLVD